MAEGATSMKCPRTQLVAAAQGPGEEKKSQAGNSPLPASTRTCIRPVIDGATLRVDDKLRVAKERREEQEKQHAAKESQILEREKKARLQYEKQMEERQRKLEEHRKKEEQRRAAVEEKRKQKQEEEKEHYEAVMRRTLERSQRLEQRQKRWSWGGALSESENKAGDPGTSFPKPVHLDEPSPSSGPSKTCEVSTVNLKQADTVISKRLSSSSATLMNSPEKSSKKRSASLTRLINKIPVPHKEFHKISQLEQTGSATKKRSSSLNRLVNKKQSSPNTEKLSKEEHQARRSLVSPLDGGVISRLLTPTQASLARSKSTAALTAEGSVSASSLHPPKGPLRSRSIDRQKGGLSSFTSSSTSEEAPGNTQNVEKEKGPPSPASKRSPSPSRLQVRRRSPSPAPSNASKRPPSPSASKPSSRNRPPSPSLLRQRPPSPQPTPKPVPILRPSLTPAGPLTFRKKETKPKEILTAGPECAQPPESSAALNTKTKDDSSAKVIAGTTSAEEAAKILAEKRRLAREQKEREELEKLQRDEEERLRKEEQRQLEEKERMKQEEEQQRLEEERRKAEEESELIAKEERAQLEKEEQERQAALQIQKDEAEARALEEAEKQRQERERIMQQNQQERMERKKRIEEIMKRTRKVESGDLKKDEKSDNFVSEENGDDLSNADSEGYDGDPTISAHGDSSVKDYGPEDVSEEAFSEGKPKEAVEPVNIGPGGERETLNGAVEDADKENNNGVAFDSIQPVSVSFTAKGALVDSEFLHLNEDVKKGLLQNLNGKSGSWTFEEFIDLGVHSKSALITVDGINADDCNQNLIEVSDIPNGPMVAFEDNGAVTSLSKSNS
ncbi:ensconsin isoform X2 [Erpetoichthys calabaricus]|uniref:ensconsin isoform X2 n=1 Tax=Erpetoichthys calabaricus TaxID=27687 RepID=UPI00109EFFA6|nr:ensconsin isoform X2 [Erpetoichthys calabaricus]